jgi:HlyD family secretion protein
MRRKSLQWKIIALAGGLILGGCSTVPPEAPDPIVPVQVFAARKGPIQRVILAEGILRALDQSSISPKISSPVSKFYVNRGDHVKRGQLLATLESRDLEANVTDAKGAYDQATAEYRNISSASVPDELAKAEADATAAEQAFDAAKKLLESQTQLYKQGAIARRLVDEANVSYAQTKSASDTAQKHLKSLQSVGRDEMVKSAAAQMESAKGKYQAAQTQLSYANIASPIDGVVADRPLYPGEMATAGTPLLTVMDISNVIAVVSLPQDQVAHVRVGQSAQLETDDGLQKLSGKVTVVSPAADPQSTTVEVWIQAPNPGERLRPGGAVRATISAETIPGAILIPAVALLPASEGGSITMVVGSDSIAHEQKVEVGVQNGDQVQILSGLTAGEQVVTEGGFGLEDGTKVSIEMPSATQEGQTHE